MGEVKRVMVMAALTLLFAFLPVRLEAQVPVRELNGPEVTFPEAFALVQGVRELADGRVMVADPLGQVLLVADLASGAADTLGGVGQGPAEYRQPDGLFPLPGDSTLLVDLGNARLTVIAPDGTFGETMPIAQGEPGRGGGLSLVLPRAVDSQGRLYFQPMGGMGRGFPDSAAVVRLDRRDQAMDTLTRVKLPAMKRSTSGGAGQQQVSLSPVPLSPEDAWAVAGDGRIAAARSTDYHLEWIHPDGRVVRGTPVDYTPVRIDRADKEEWVEGLGNGLTIGVMIENGDRRVSLSRGGGGSGSLDVDRFEWPEHKPAFAARGVWVTPEGAVWVQRHVPAGERPLFDVFDGAAKLKARVTLPEGRQLVGFGRDVLYAVRSDDYGLQWLERYRRAGD